MAARPSVNYEFQRTAKEDRSKAQTGTEAGKTPEKDGEVITIRATYFSKRRNSTAVPDGFDAEYRVAFKGSCSYDNPVFLLSEASFLYNYVEWSGWYYYVSDVVVIRDNLLEVHCTVDALGTFRDDIRNSRQFVAYDTTPNTEISDKRLSTKTTTVRAEAVGSAFEYIGADFCVMLNVVGDAACCTYAMTIGAASDLLNNVNTWGQSILPDVDPADPPADWLSKIADSITKGFRQLISSPSAASCIKSAYIIPIGYGKIPGTVENVMLGQFDTGIAGKRLTTRGLQDAAAVAIPWQTQDWRRNSPYTEIYLYLPILGNISLPASGLIGAEYIYIDMSIDMTAGDCIITLATDPLSGGAANHVIGQYAVNIAANFQIGAAAAGTTQILGGIAAGVGGIAATIATGGAAAVAVGTAAIAGEFNGMTPIATSIGSAGGGAILALFGFLPRCMVIFHDTVTEPDAVRDIIGTPSMEVKSLSGLSGYVECRNAHVPIIGHDSVMNEIDNALNSGVYLE